MTTSTVVILVSSRSFRSLALASTAERTPEEAPRSALQKKHQDRTMAADSFAGGARATATSAASATPGGRDDRVRGRGRQLAQRARLMAEARAQKLAGRETFQLLAKERRSSALRRSISSPSTSERHGGDIVLLNAANTPATVANMQRRAALARQPPPSTADSRRNSIGECFTHAANAPLSLSPTDALGGYELPSPEQERRRREERTSFVRRGSMGEYGSHEDGPEAASMFRQQSNIPYGHMAFAAAAAAAAAAATAAAAAAPVVDASPPAATTASVETPAAGLVVSPHSSVGELDRKLRELGCRDERLGRMLGEMAGHSAPEPEPEPGPEAGAESAPEPEAGTEPEPEPEAGAEVEVEAETQAETQGEVEADLESETCG
jgi:hypothetical protein